MDIFKFWSEIKHGEKIHPADKDVLGRINPDKHGFSTDCLPACYMGNLRSAPIVLLYLSPGFGEQDLKDAKSKAGKDYYFRRWKGDEPLPSPDGAGHSWLKSRTKIFGDYDFIKDKIAVLNIGAYHSKDVRSYSSLLALPSSRTSLSWAQNFLFPQAEAGKRVVICMRSAAYWGLESGKQYGKALFAPHVTRSGHMIQNSQYPKIINAAKKLIG